MNSACRITLFFLAILAGSHLFLAGSPATAQSGTRVIRRPHYELLWGWLAQSQYRNWKGPNGQPAEFQPGEGPHAALVKTYVNDHAAGDAKNLSRGSVLVTENYSAEKRLLSVTVMQRAPGFDPPQGDWYYAQYLPQGRIAADVVGRNTEPAAGKVSSCIDCHRKAGGGDYAYFNDPPVLNTSP
ncbi:cytochrome P460 family protein [Lignipirellula cremea]|uniref:Cytochrome P460 domain-containing protein n=1 Tax=Lignipirellula cremea TaxID=2528010 RepID=A0A518DYR2_9BACT|nr:cytochrome P460 family protein [Lignipirellula cremea]QDU96978.1 hypothetical protein Pla8534_48030 [Lignipirellula cremea]